MQSERMEVTDLKNISKFSAAISKIYLLRKQKKRLESLFIELIYLYK